MWYIIEFGVSFTNDSMVKNLPVVQETQEMGVWTLGQEDPLEGVCNALPEKFLPEKFHGQRSLVGYSPKGQRLYMTEWLNTTSYYAVFLEELHFL